MYRYRFAYKYMETDVCIQYTVVNKTHWKCNQDNEIKYDQKPDL